MAKSSCRVEMARVTRCTGCEHLAAEAVADGVIVTVESLAAALEKVRLDSWRGRQSPTPHDHAPHARAIIAALRDAT